jgi:rRNA-processing protein FCF1
MRPARATTRSPRPNGDVVVVTADRELAERVRAANAEVVGPSWLIDQLVD